MDLTELLSNATNDPNFYGALAAAASLGQSMQPSRYPRNQFGSLLEALGAYGGGRQNAQNFLTRDKFLKAKMNQFERDQAQSDALQSQYAEMVGGHDPRTGITWNTGRMIPGSLAPNMGIPGDSPQTQLSEVESGTPVGVPGPTSLGRADGQPRSPIPLPLQGVLRGLPAEKGMAILADKYLSGHKPPTLRDFTVGDRVVTRRWDANAGEWVDVESSPRWKPGDRGGLTPAQEANNEEIDAARRVIRERYPNLNAEEIARRTADATRTGRTNFDYDQNLATLLRRATQRKVGGDQAFELLYRQWYGKAPPAEGDNGFSPSGRASEISRMTYGELDALTSNASEDDFTPAELQAIDARLRALGY